MSEDSHWIERAQSAEARYNTLSEQMERVKEDAKVVLQLFAARKRQNGSYDINFDKLVDQLGLEKSMELRAVIDQRWRVSGAPGEKPHIKLVSK